MPDFAVIGVNTHLRYGFFARKESFTPGVFPPPTGFIPGSGLVLCYHDAAGEVRSAVYGKVADPLTAQDCTRELLETRTDYADLPSWLEVGNLAESAPMLGGTIQQVTVGYCIPLATVYLFRRGIGRDEKFFIVARDKTEHITPGCRTEQGTRERVLTKFSEPGSFIVINADSQRVFYAGSFGQGDDTRLIISLSRIPKGAVSFDDRVFMLPASLLPINDRDSVATRIRLIQKALATPMIKAADLSPRRMG